MSSRLLKETPWDKKEDRERDLGEEVGWGGGRLMEETGMSLSPVHPSSLKCHSTVGPIVRPPRKACLQLA